MLLHVFNIMYKFVKIMSFWFFLFRHLLQYQVLNEGKVVKVNYTGTYYLDFC